MFSEGEVVLWKPPLWDTRDKGAKSTVVIRVAVKIVEIRRAFGRLDYRVVPVQGDGECWVSENSLYAIAQDL